MELKKVGHMKVQVKLKKQKKNMGTRMSKYIKIILYILKKIIAP
jgi:hypothetical protein